MSTATRDRIVATAEVLFATKGYAATTTREITAAADVNIAAVNYHFGSKENLLAEILDGIVVPLNAERLVLLDAAEADGATPDVRQVLTAFLLPDLHAIAQLRGRHADLPRFVSRMYSESSEMMARLVGRQFADTQKRFYAAFAAALPDLDAEAIAWRLHAIVGIVLYLFAGVEVPGHGQMLGSDTDANLRRLLEVTVPLMTAPREEVASLD